MLAGHRYETEVCEIEAPAYRDLDEEPFVSCHCAESLDLRPVQREPGRT
jgi:hypothetical protein